MKATIPAVTSVSGAGRAEAGRSDAGGAEAARTRREEYAAATRQALLDSAEALFAAHGYAGTSLDQVATSARVTKGAVYHHFDDKRALFEEVSQRLGHQSAQTLAAAAGGGAPPGGRDLEAVLDAFLDQCADPAYRRVRLLDGPGGLGFERWWQSAVETEGAAISAALGSLRERGALAARLADSDLDPLAGLIFGAMTAAALSLARAEETTLARERLRSAMLDLVSGLLSPEPGAREPGSADNGAKGKAGGTASRRRARKKDAPLCLVVQHIDPEGPYAIGAALEAAGVEVRVCRVQRGEGLPESAEELDGLVVMGGPMSAASDDAYPTRRQELSLLADAVDRAVPVLGVCLGAQLLALAAGGAVYRGASGTEIGWGPIELTDAARADALLTGAPPQVDVLHWHGDTFDLPPGAIRLAGNAQYANQAFRVGESAWGLQFHVEVDEDAVRSFVGAFGDDLAGAGIEASSITGTAPAALSALAPVRDAVTARWAALVRERSVKSPR